MSSADEEDEAGLAEGHDEGRKIVHVDMDAFYASVEQRDDPALRGRPVAVGGSAARGVVAAASYEARRFGVRSAMPSVTARRLCPDLVFVKARFDVYRAVSAEIREIFAEFTDLIEPLSLDEAYLDVTENKRGIEHASAVAREIRRRIKEVTGLNASAGISYNKFLAKTASDLNKPNGQAVITPDKGPAFVADLAVAKFHGVGPATARRMEALGITTGSDLRDKPLAWLEEHFGKSGRWYYRISRGIDRRPVQPHRTRKSVGSEDTFSQDIVDWDPASAELARLSAKVWASLEGKRLHGRTATVKVKYSDFRQITRRTTRPAPFKTEAELRDTADALLKPLYPFERSVRLLGVTVSGFTADEPDGEPAKQLSLW